ncbi:KAP family P-loop NTPase fold protein [Amniculibacterium aquaticum]|uniref:KAP family P-loop NTPase fold protein n=1 Tax=Amniculibacterium aquaticum TaxID=2479858 RepID=UPI000F592D8A|nr:P-loop NTPase fold protein [Amniculibacterium aquaticum]
MWKDSETDIDLLDFDYLIEITKDIVENDELSPCTIGVYGDWGSGKSSLVEMILKDYEKKENYLCLKFNGWLFEDYEDAKNALLGSILDEINKKKGITTKAKNTIKKLFKNIDYIDLASKGLKYGTDFLLTGGIGTIADITIQNVLNKTKSLGDGVTSEEIKKVLEGTFKKEEVRKNLREFQSDFEKLLKETKIEKLVVFIDELDRCNHDTILETLEAIRLFLFTKGTSFIIGADERQVMYAVRKKFPEVKGNQMDIGKEYLEKMIQYPIKIPQLGVNEVEFYITCLFFQNEFKENYSEIIKFIKTKRKEDFLNFEITYDLIKNEFDYLDESKIREVISISKQISSVLSNSLNGNPRHCKRFLNSLSMRIKMASFKNIILDKKVLAKLMLIEYFKDEVFKKIGQLQSNEKGKPNELKLIEDDEWENVKDLKLWENDEWFLKWAKTEPKLSEYDLQKYYYFTRESLKSNSFKTILSLSPEAEAVLNNLLSNSDSFRKEAVKKASIINDYESLEILKSIFYSIESSSDIETNMFKSFMEWASTKEVLYTDAISKLSSLPAESIKISFIPNIFEFGKISNKEAEIKALTDKWKVENPKLITAIKNK